MVRGADSVSLAALIRTRIPGERSIGSRACCRGSAAVEHPIGAWKDHRIGAELGLVLCCLTQQHAEQVAGLVRIREQIEFFKPLGMDKLVADVAQR